MDLYRTIQNLLKDKDRWGKVLSSPVSYRIVDGALTLARKSFPWQAIYQMSRFALNQTRHAYTGRVPVVWSSAFFPVEIAWSLDVCPFSPEIAAAFITALGFGGEALSNAEAAGYSRDLCSFHRCVAGAAMAGHLPKPAALLASTHLCDGAPLLFQNMAELYKAPCFVLDVPYTADRDAEVYVAGQIERIWHELADLAGRRPEEARLAEAIRRSEEFRNNMIRANELRCRVPSPISGNDMLSFIYLFFIGQGSREAAEISACLTGEIEGKIARGYENGAEKFRLLWLHLKPYYSNEVMGFVEQAGGVLAFEEFNHIYWPPLEPDEPFLSLARKVLTHFDYKPVSERIRVIRELAEKYRVDGIVHFSHHGCRQSTGGSLILKDALQEAGWPVLNLEGDCLDGRNEAAGGMLTRLQAFFEILEERKKGCLL